MILFSLAASIILVLPTLLLKTPFLFRWYLIFISLIIFYPFLYDLTYILLDMDEYIPKDNHTIWFVILGYPLTISILPAFFINSFIQKIKFKSSDIFLFILIFLSIYTQYFYNTSRP